MYCHIFLKWPNIKNILAYTLSIYLFHKLSLLVKCLFSKHFPWYHFRGAWGFFLFCFPQLTWISCQHSHSNDTQQGMNKFCTVLIRTQSSFPHAYMSKTKVSFPSLKSSGFLKRDIPVNIYFQTSSGHVHVHQRILVQVHDSPGTCIFSQSLTFCGVEQINHHLL